MSLKNSVGRALSLVVVAALSANAGAVELQIHPTIGAPSSAVVLSAVPPLSAAAPLALGGSSVLSAPAVASAAPVAAFAAAVPVAVPAAAPVAVPAFAALSAARPSATASRDASENSGAAFGALFDGHGRFADATASVPVLSAPSGDAPFRGSAAALAASSPAAAPANGTVAFITDFGVKDPAVGICKLVMTGINAALNVFDLSHLIPPFNIRLAADFLAAAIQHAKPGTTFVAVVDPGVGSARRSIAVRTKGGHLLVGPDNGVFAKAIAAAGGVDKAVELANPEYFHRPAVSSTFHGRDIYAPVGAHLASGVPLEKLGPDVEDLKPLEVRPARLENGAIVGEVAYVEDPFGSVLTDIPRALVEEAGWRPRQGLKLEIRIGDRTVVLPYEKTFSDVRVGEELALIHSREVLSFSINQGHFGAAHGVKEGDSVVVRLVP